mgnify:CR=1 FL=1
MVEQGGRGYWVIIVSFFLAMILAHLVGDFMLQTDKLAAWKNRDVRGILTHGSVILVVTGFFALPFDPFWWQGVLFITVTHTAIDGIQLYFQPQIAPILRFFSDQFLHFLFIFIAIDSTFFIINI